MVFVAEPPVALELFSLVFLRLFQFRFVLLEVLVLVLLTLLLDDESPPIPTPIPMPTPTPVALEFELLLPPPLDPSQPPLGGSELPLPPPQSAYAGRDRAQDNASARIENFFILSYPINS